ncbi:dTDP-glucose 4,6-dehydratase [Desulfovibrio sp. OttesenSCG-928-C06]|nr:dTDP-glucose 4,6-dehydratase [Desulfovibrio sp. OttesenSCG-928-C06]
MGKRKLYLVTGGAGFIGSCFVLRALRQDGATIVNLDKLTYSGNPANLREVENNPDYHFAHGDIGDAAMIGKLLREHQPDAVINFAAESHVDRSIADPTPFVETNVTGTCVLLGTVLEWWRTLEPAKAQDFRFLHVSTDEVFGSLGPNDPAFTESTPYAPNSPYSASKASSDHFARAFYETYGLPVLITNCSNNYGPRQFPEKLIPLVILKALAGQEIPVYGKGENIRDWLHVEDHCDAIARVLEGGRIGQTYNIGGRSERSNLQVVETICELLDGIRPGPKAPRKQLINFVKDRPGHDFRYAINCAKIEKELDWTPKYDFRSGLAETVRWYLDNTDWLAEVQSGEYRNWLKSNYDER